jgi:hypothetical protein
MEPESSELHVLLADAVERAALAQEESHDLLERQLTLTTALHTTLVEVRENRRSRAGAFGNGQRGARRRWRPG